jgi:ribosomal protein S12 methylthiotransferase accessory factor
MTQNGLPAWRDLRAELPDKLSRLVDDDYGVVRTVYEVPRSAGAPMFFHARAEAARTERLGGYANHRYGGAASVSRSRAASKAVGEAVERYCSAQFALHELPLIARRHASFRCIDPQELALFDDSQYDTTDFPYAKFTDESEVRWTAAHDFTDGAAYYIPAVTAWFPFWPANDSHPIMPSVTTGLACHTDRRRAILSALCEVVERDAFMLTWQTQRSPPRIDPSDLDHTAHALLGRFAAAGYKAELFDITTDICIPSILAVARPSFSVRGPRLSVATAVHPDPGTAVLKALEELEHTRAYSSQVDLPDELIAPEAVHDQEDHLRFWGQRDVAADAGFLFAGQQADLAQPPSSVQGDDMLTTAVAAVTQAGYRVLVADLTTVDVREAGVTVVRVVIPGAQPLFFGHSHQASGGKRLAAASAESGSRLNPLPHPFP